jgi:glutathione S-transferase
MYRIYGDSQSGNCYKLALLASLANIPHEWVEVDILAGDTQKAEFLAKNANGKIPLLEIDSSTFLPESNAILNYLAEGTNFLPKDRLLRAQVLQWQFFEQYSHEPYIAVARFINKYLGLPDDRKQEYMSKQEGGHKALAVMERHLAKQSFFVANQPSIADISLYAYTHVADEGGFDLGVYPSIQNWIKSIQQLDGYIEMPKG